MSDPFAEQTLFDLPPVPPRDLFKEFGMPPFSTLDRRQGNWQDRKRRWLSLGIQSEVGRDDALIYQRPSEGSADVSRKIYDLSQGTSVFDPVVAECAVRWYSARGGLVLDPFAGGSVRGIVSSVLGRHYVGVDLRHEQIAANRDQRGIADPEYPPRWLLGDSRHLSDLVRVSQVEPADLVFSCPPYFDLEQYSDDPSDLSGMSWEAFCAAYWEIIAAACQHLRDDRFAVWVIGDVRDKKGILRGLVPETIAAFQAAGLQYYNSAITIDPIGTGAIVAGRRFRASRKLVTMHQHFLVFVKGDPKRAATWAASTEPVLDNTSDEE
jgi:hypothetical protein